MLDNTICFEDKTIDIRIKHDTYRIAYIRCSPPTRLPVKDTIVLLHDFFEIRWQFEQIIDLFALAGYNVLAPNLPGSLVWSSQWKGDVPTVTLLAQQLAELLRELRVSRKVHLVGCGLGSEVALALLHIYNHSIASITYMAAILKIGQPVSLQTMVTRYMEEIEQPDVAVSMLSLYHSAGQSNRGSVPTTNKLPAGLPYLVLQAEGTSPLLQSRKDVDAEYHCSKNTSMTAMRMLKESPEEFLVTVLTFLNTVTQSEKKSITKRLFVSRL